MTTSTTNSQEPPYKALLEDLLSQWIYNPELLDAARNLIEPAIPSALNFAKVGNWKDRGIPTTLVEGAAMLLAAIRANEFAVDSSSHSAPARKEIVADTFYTSFYVHDLLDKTGSGGPQSPNDFLDCHVVRYWEGLRIVNGAPDDTLSFTHSNLTTSIEGIEEFALIGENQNNKKTGKPVMVHPFHSPRRHASYTQRQADEPEDMFYVKFNLNGEQTYDLGYRFIARGSVSKKVIEDNPSKSLKSTGVDSTATPKPRRWEALTTTPHIRAKKVVLLASVPNEYNANLLPYMISFAQPMNPEVFINELMKRIHLAGPSKKGGPITDQIQPWGTYSASTDRFLNVPLPALLFEAMRGFTPFGDPEPIDVWGTRPFAQQIGRNRFMAEFIDSMPLMHYGFFYRLPAEEADE